MSDILNHSYAILRFNYGIVFFASVILMFFFASTIYKIFIDRNDFNNIISISNKICVKFDANGLIIDYNKHFADIATLKGENVKGRDIFKLISFDNYDEMMKTIFYDISHNEQKSFECNVTCRNNEIKKVSFLGILNSNFLGASSSYILVGTDVTLNERTERELDITRNRLESLIKEFKFAEEELARNFKQIQDTQNKIESLKKRHKVFIDSIPIGVTQFDFSTRQIAFSLETLKFFIPNVSTSTIYPDEALAVFYNFIKKESIYDLLESVYNALANKSINFSTEILLTNNIRVPVQLTIVYENNEPSYLFAISDYYELNKNQFD